MRHKIILSAVVLLLFAPAVAVRAQSSTDEHKFEVGALFTAIGVEDGSAVKGLGARVGYNFNEYVALDAEGSFFPETAFDNNQSGQKTQGFIGVKAGKRFERVGVFAKARPGAMFLGDVTTGFNCTQQGTFQTCRPEHNAFAFDAGAVVEVYPTSRAIIRFDAGDTMIRFKRATGRFLGSPVQTTSEFSHNLQLSIGFSYRF